MARSPRGGGGGGPACLRARVAMFMLMIFLSIIVDRFRFLASFVALIALVADANGGDATFTKSVVVAAAAAAVVEVLFFAFARRVGNRSALAGAAGILSVVPIRHNTDCSRDLADLSLSAPSAAADAGSTNAASSAGDGGERASSSTSNIVVLIVIVSTYCGLWV